jgi:hypothetical protein
MNKFYVYCIFRPWNLEPCYIGKGSGYRTKQHFRSLERHPNPHLVAIIKRAEGAEVPCVIMHDGLDEATAFEYEKAFIAAIGRSDLGLGPLCNMTDGGEGCSGRRHTPEACLKIAESHRGKKRSPEAVANMRAAQKGRIITPEARKKISASLTGRSSPPGHMARLAEINRGNKYTLGRKFSEDHRKKISDALMGKPRSKETKERLRELNLGRKHTEETREKMRMSAQNRAPISDENRIKLSDAVKRSWKIRKNSI